MTILLIQPNVRIHRHIRKFRDNVTLNFIERIAFSTVNKSKRYRKGADFLVNRVYKNPGNHTPYGYSINTSETDLSERNEPFSEKMSHLDSSGHDNIVVGQHPQTCFRICLPCQCSLGGKTYRTIFAARTDKAA